MLKVLDLFSGIGGFSLGLERTGGFETVAFCEIEEYPQKVLAKHWPGVPIYNDVMELTNDRLNADGIFPDIITGGFPCQDISVAGNQKGIGEGTRSGLWSECARLVGEIRPDYAIFENVTALLSGADGKWFQRVLWDISQIGGYVVEWHCIPASQLGAHHHRDRIWIILRNTDSERLEELDLASLSGEPVQSSRGYDKRKGNAPDTNDKRSVQRVITGVSGGEGTEPNDQPTQGRGEVHGREGADRILADTDSSGGSQSDVPNPNGTRLERWLQHEIAYQEGWEIQSNRCVTECGTGRERHRDGIWATEPAVCGISHGLCDGLYEGRVTTGAKDRAKRLKTLGNSVVPQIPELIGRAILEAENESDI